MRKNKKISSKKYLSNKKVVRHDIDVEPCLLQYFLLDFSLIDNDHKTWGFRNLDTPKYQDLIKKLSDFCGMTWQEILRANGGKSMGHGNNNHDCELGEFCKEATERLGELHIEDIDSLFSLRLSGKTRLYGTREQNIFKPVWYDQYHGEQKGAYRVKR